MRILLDTSYLYRFMAEPAGFSGEEFRLFSALDTRIYVSAVSIWEMRLKYRARHASGARKSPFRPGDVLAALEGQEVTFLPLAIRHAARDLEPPLAHKDPFDEILLVQAQAENLKLLTADRLIVGHPLAIAAQTMH